MCAVLLQTMPVEDEDKYDFDPLDVTKIWPEQLFPLQPVGRMVLNKNPDNFFNENEQIAFCPALVVPGAHQLPTQQERLPLKQAQLSCSSAHSRANAA